MARPRTEPAAARRRRILDAARRLLVRMDYRDIRLDEVAAEAGIAKGTVYLYFRDKKDLITSVLADLLSALGARLSTIPPSCRGCEALERLAGEHLEFVEEHKDFIAQLSTQAPYISPGEGGLPFRESIGRHLKALGARLKACAADGALRPHDPALGAMFFMSLVRFFLVRKLLLGSTKRLRDCSGEFLDLYLNGLGRHAAGPETRRRRA